MESSRALAVTTPGGQGSGEACCALWTNFVMLEDRKSLLSLASECGIP